MRSRTSFFNRTLFQKSALRFWPLWGSYLALWLLLLPVSLLSNNVFLRTHSLYYGQEYILTLARLGGVFISAGYGVASAMAMFGYLYNARAAHGYACLPVRREGQYCSAVLAGLLPYVVANALVLLLTLLVEASFGIVQVRALLEWFGAVTLLYLFFYCFAVFCAQLTGNIIILPLVYAVLNFTAWAVELMLRIILSNFIFGMANFYGTESHYTFLSPIIFLFRSLHLGTTYVDHVSPPDEPLYYEVAGYFLQGWRYLICYAVAGLVFLVCGALLYRRRKMETAGDVVAVKPLKPVYRWCMALGCGLCLSVLLDLMFNLTQGGGNRDASFLLTLLFLLIGAFVGWFGAEMMMKKTFRVFSRRCWSGYGLCGLVLVALILGMHFDLFGYERHVPQVDDIVGATLVTDSRTTAQADLKEPENLAELVALHQSIIQHKDWHLQRSERTMPGDDRLGVGVRLAYFLKNGRTMSRYYRLYWYDDDRDVGDGEALQALLNCQEAIDNRKKTNVEFNRDTIYYCNISAAMTAEECARAGGWDSAEDFILTCAGYSRMEIASMGEFERRVNVNRGILDYAMNTPFKQGMLDPYNMNDQEISKVSFDMDEVYFYHTLSFSAADAAELYQERIVPDIQEGTLGRVSILPDALYDDTFYNARIEIGCRKIVPGNAAATASDLSTYEEGTSTISDWFYTTPTVDSRRTNQWLAAHGISLHTNGETGNGSPLYDYFA